MSHPSTSDYSSNVASADTEKVRSVRVFLCYRRKDGEWSAEWLYRHLNGFAYPCPDGTTARLRIYYDKMAPGIANWKKLHFPSLQSARALIVICTPGISKDLTQPGKPDWVYEELRWWIRHRKQAPIVVDATGGDERWLPELLTRKWPDINRVELNESSAKEAATNDDPSFAERIRQRIAGAIRESEHSTVFEDLERFRLLSRRLLVALAGAVVLFLIAATLGFYAYEAKQTADSMRSRAQTNSAAAKKSAEIAEQERRAAVRQAQIAQARYLSAAAVRALSDDPELTILLALRAVEFSSNHDAIISEVEEALHKGVQASRVRATLSGHGEVVNDALLDESRNLAVTGSRDGSFRAWDLATGQQVAASSWISGKLSHLSMSRHAGSVVTVDDDASVRIHDLWSGEVVAELGQGESSVSAVAISADGRYVAAGDKAGAVTVWRVGVQGKITHITLNLDRVTKLGFSKDGARLATGSADGSITVWHSDTGKELVAFPSVRRANAVSAVVFSDDGRWIATGHRDDNVRIWDLENLQLMRTLEGHHEDPTSINFSLDGEKLVTGGRDRIAIVWDLTSGEKLLRLAGHTGTVESVAFTAGGDRVITGSSDRTARIWQINAAREVAKLSVEKERISEIAFSSNGERLVTGSWETEGATTRVWSVGPWKEVARFQGPSGQSASHAAISANGEYAAISGGRTPIVWDIETQMESVRLTGHSGSVSSIAFSLDGERIATSSFDNTVRLWKRETGELLKTFLGHRSYVVKVAFSSDDMHLISGAHDHSLRVWDIETEREVAGLQDVGCPISLSLAISPDSKRAVTCGKDTATPRVWDLTSGKPLVDLVSYTNQVNRVAFSPDGTRLVSRLPEHKRTRFSAQRA